MLFQRGLHRNNTYLNDTSHTYPKNDLKTDQVGVRSVFVPSVDESGADAAESHSDGEKRCVVAAERYSHTYNGQYLNFELENPI